MAAAVAAHPRIGAQASTLARDLSLASSSASFIPKLLYGTAWKQEKTEDLVYKAIKNGFRGIDTAAQPKHYDEKSVGGAVAKAVADGLVRRQDLFIQTKFTPPAGQSNIKPYSTDSPLIEQVKQSLSSSLENFKLNDQDEPYLDSVVLHSPLDDFQDTLAVWRTLEQYTPNTIRNLGISNTNLSTLSKLYDQAHVKPSVVQNRFYNGTQFDVELRDYCQSKGIVFQSFWTLSANRKLSQTSLVTDLADLAGVSPEMAYYALVLGLGNIVILNGTTNEAHMKDDMTGLERIGMWVEGEGAEEWAEALGRFKRLIGDD